MKATMLTRGAVVVGTAALIWVVPVLVTSCTSSAPQAASRTFATPDDAVKGLADATRAGKIDELRAIFGPEANDLIDTADPVTARRNREIFAAAFRERWRLEDTAADTKTLVIGNEDWPFPIPLVREGKVWRFDGAAGLEEVLDRRVGRNELAVITLCKTYVAAQRLYAAKPHDGKPAGVYAASFRSEPGKQNGLYWPVKPGEKRSPLGDLVAYAEQQGRSIGAGNSPPAPFHGYYFRILTAQGPNAPGGAKDYVVGGAMKGGFALVAWPAQYDATGVMTFVVGPDGTVREKDLGPDTVNAVRGLTVFDPDASWGAAH